MKKALLFCSLIYLTGMLHAQVTRGLVAYYPFTGNANDLSGKGNDGTTSGGVTLTADRFGTPNSAYLFNGSNGYIFIPNSKSLQSPGTTNTITQTAWVYLNGLSLIGSAFGPVTMKSNSSANSFMYRMDLDYNGVGASYIDWNHSQGGGHPLNLHTWYFIVTTYNGSVGKTYVNDTLVGTTTLNLTIPTDDLPLTIGRDAPGIEEYFNGIIDDVRIYNRALSQKEIDSLANDLPVVSIADKSTNEGNSGTSIMKFKVSLNHAYDTIVKVKYKTADSTAHASSDYVVASGALTFQPGQISKTISVTIKGDATPEKNERFKVLLSKPVNASLGDSVAIGTIKNDDGTLLTSEIITDINVKQQLVISPNPANDVIHIDGLKDKKLGIAITDANGKVVLQQIAFAGGEINIAKLSKGNYFITVTAGSKTQTIEFVKL